MEAFAVISVSDIDSFVARYGMRIDHRRRMNAMLPFLLHLRMHHQKRVVRQVYRDLAFSVCPLVFGGCWLFVIPGYDFPYSKFSSNPKTQAANDGSRSKVGQLIAVIAHAFASALVAVDERRVRDPLVG